MFTVLKRFSSDEDEIARYNTWLNGPTTLHLKTRGNPKKIFWIYDFWKSSTKSLSKTLLILPLTLFILSTVAVHAQADRNSFSTDYNLNGKRVTYYPESLMISHNPLSVVFYKNNKLFDLFVYLRAPDMGTDFTINNTCNKDASEFLNQLLEQIPAYQKAMQRLLSMHSYTSSIECDSYLRRYYQYSTGFSSTMT